jgi:integrase
MPKAHLTDITVRALKPGSKQLTYWDSTLPGFGLRVSQAGAKSWVVMSGRERRLTTLARYPTMPLKDARVAARKYLTSEKPAPAMMMTFREARTLFLASREQRNKKRTVSDYRRLLTRHFTQFDNRPLNEITTDQLMKVIDGLSETPSEQNHAFVAARTMLRACTARRFIPRSPLEGLGAPTKPAARDRVLSDEEMTQILTTAFSARSIFNQIVLLCLFTGLRRTEAAALRWEWIREEDRTITLPPAITKNNRGHTFPYGDAVADLLTFVSSREGFLFPGRDSKEQFFNGWSRSKENFDRHCAARGWTLHDLRRTFATNLAALGTPVQVTERLLNHVSGTVSGVAAIYNRHSYMPEMRAALQAWEAKVRLLAQG